MRAFVSLWSADLLAVGAAVAAIDDVVDGYHIDVFDGHNVPELLFGPDFVARLREVTRRPIEVHLNVLDPHYWTIRFAEVGADFITVQSAPSVDVAATIEHIRANGCRVGLGVELHEPVEIAEPLLPLLDRVLVLGTPIGVKGRDLDPDTPDRVTRLARLRADRQETVSIVVDGGIRSHTVARLAAAGADGVIPGSLVLGAPDPRAALRELHALTSRVPA